MTFTYPGVRRLRCRLQMRSFLHFQVNPSLHQRGSLGHIESHWLINELKVSALRLFKPTYPLIGGQVLQHLGELSPQP